MNRLVATILWLLPCLALADIDYVISVDKPANSLRVSMTLDSPSGEVKFVIPSWCPGFYTLKSYKDKIFDFRVRDKSGIEIPVKQVGSTWSISFPKPTELTASYRVLGDDPGLGFFGTSVKDKLAFVNGPSAFVYVEGRKSEKCRLAIKVPEGWQIATSMDFEGDGYIASEYDELLDHPIQLGEFARQSFKVSGIPFEVVVASQNGRYPNMLALAKNLQAISEPAIELFGSASFKKYTYMLHLGVGDFAGGLEHRASTTIAVDFEDPLELGSLAGHEYFHAWNVKQIRPAVLGPFDYTTKVRTKNLWWAEGVTDYYAYLLAVPAGIIGESDLLESIGNQIDELQSSQTRLSKSLEDVCWNTWESSGFGFGDLSYYTKGYVVGFLLDAAIIEATDGQKTLDDVMRLMYERHRLPKPGYGEDEIRATINEVSGKDLSNVYNRCIRSTAELPYELANRIGLEVLRPMSQTDVLGFDVNRGGQVDCVEPIVAAMGLYVGDEIVEVNDRPLKDAENLSVPKANYSLLVNRGGLRIKLNLQLIAGSTTGFTVRRSTSADERAKRLYSVWIKRNRSSN